jgi:DNA-binding PadR family transcriptional regulator
MAVLAYLLEKPRHPYELSKLFQQRNKQGSIDHKHASIYMVVEQLLRDGHIEAHEADRHGQRPERTVYRLTEAGRVELRTRMREELSAPAREPRAFEGVLSVIAAMPPTEVVELLDEREQALDAQATRLRAHLHEIEDVPRLFLVEHEYRLGQIDAERRFVEQFKAAIRADDDSLASFWNDLHRRILRESPGTTR